MKSLTHDNYDIYLVIIIIYFFSCAYKHNHFYSIDKATADMMPAGKSDARTKHKVNFLELLKFSENLI